eukprot:2393629-Rhodomonas_salina.1
MKDTIRAALRSARNQMLSAARSVPFVPEARGAACICSAFIGCGGAPIYGGNDSIHGGNDSIHGGNGSVLLDGDAAVFAGSAAIYGGTTLTGAMPGAASWSPPL